MPIKVKVRYFTTLRELAQRAVEEFELKDYAILRDLLEAIALKYGDEAKRYLYVDDDQKAIDPSLRILINGMDSKMLKGPETRLNDEDVVAIIPPIGGG
ncbi:MAG: MoaD/ThiS family protein [Candidatus Bathyarchaeia archaeon]